MILIRIIGGLQACRIQKRNSSQLYSIPREPPEDPRECSTGGDPFDSMDRFAEDMETNIKLLRNLSKSISFEYNMGMNMTHISLP